MALRIRNCVLMPSILVTRLDLTGSGCLIWMCVIYFSQTCKASTAGSHCHSVATGAIWSWCLVIFASLRGIINTSEEEVGKQRMLHIMCIYAVITLYLMFLGCATHVHYLCLFNMIWILSIMRAQNDIKDMH